MEDHHILLLILILKIKSKLYVIYLKFHEIKKICISKIFSINKN